MIVELVFNIILNKGIVYPLLASVLTYSSISVIHFLIRRNRRYKLFAHYGIPGPKPNLLEGNLGRYLSAKLGALVEQEYVDTYGEVYGVFVGDEPSIVITNLDILRQIFFVETQAFTERTMVFIEDPLAHGLIFAKYHRWKAMRKVMSPSFARYTRRGGKSTEFLEESTSLIFAYIEQKRCESPGAERKSVTINVCKLMKSAALHLISEMAIRLPNVDVSENNQYVKNLDQFMETAGYGVVVWAIRFPFLAKLFSFMANHFEYDKVLGLTRRSIERMIDNGAKKYSKLGQLNNRDEESEQIIDLLVRLHYEGKMTRAEVIGNAETILIAGYDTTSTTISYILWILGKYQEVQKQLREELIAHGIESKFMVQVIYETMRLYPTVTGFATRLATKTVKINNLTIPQGTRIVHNCWLMHRNPKIWKEPLEFDPERFKEGADIHPCAFAPFGLGDRICLGYKLAMLEIKIILCDVLLRYKLKTLGPNKLELKTHGVILTAPVEPVMIDFEKL